MSGGSLPAEALGCAGGQGHRCDGGTGVLLPLELAPTAISLSSSVSSALHLCQGSVFPFVPQDDFLFLLTLRKERKDPEI